MGMNPVDPFNKYPSFPNTHNMIGLLQFLECWDFRSCWRAGLCHWCGFLLFCLCLYLKVSHFQVAPSPFMFFLGILENSCSWLQGPIALLYLRLLMFHFLFVHSTWKTFSCIFYVGYWVVQCYSRFSFELSSLVFFTDFSFYILGCLPHSFRLMLCFPGQFSGIYFP